MQKNHLISKTVNTYIIPSVYAMIFILWFTLGNYGHSEYLFITPPQACYLISTPFFSVYFGCYSYFVMRKTIIPNLYYALLLFVTVFAPFVVKDRFLINWIVVPIFIAISLISSIITRIFDKLIKSKPNIKFCLILLPLFLLFAFFGTQSSIFWFLAGVVLVVAIFWLCFSIYSKSTRDTKP